MEPCECLFQWRSRPVVLYQQYCFKVTKKKQVIKYLKTFVFLVFRFVFYAFCVIHLFFMARVSTDQENSGRDIEMGL